MTVAPAPSDFQRFVPLVGDIQQKTAIAYRLTRTAVLGVNAVQMAFAESYNQWSNTA